MSQSAYDELLKAYKDISIFRSIRGVLSWDIETKKMPSQGLANRSNQFALISRYVNDFWNSQKVGNLIAQINSDQLESQLQKRNFELIQKRYTVETKMPIDLISKISAQATKTNEVWKKAKAKSDFSIVQDEMAKLIGLNIEHAKKLAEIKQINDPFDAAVDERDEGLKTKVIDSLFSSARDFLVPFIKRNEEKFRIDNSSIPTIKVSREQQITLAHEIAKIFEYPTTWADPENARGNIDEVEHPLTIPCGPDDVRVTVKYDDYLNVINATNHELGHGIHSLNKNQDWNFQPVNDAGYPSLGECNSRYTENKIGVSHEYYKCLLPILNKVTNDKFANIGSDELYNYIRQISPGTSRMRADEVTYGLHIIIRYEIEKEIYNDRVTVPELPQLWNQKYEEYLGVDVPNDTLGIMQDLHWYSRWLAYFHGYFMGDLMGSQFHAYMEKDHPDWKTELENGNLHPVLEWNTQNIYSKGGLYPSLELVKHVTGEDINVGYFKKYIEAKYNE